MSDVLISPSRHKKEPHLQGPVLLFVNPGETDIVRREAKRLQATKHFLFNSNLFSIPGANASYWAGPAFGAPMAAMTLEKLIALGAKEFIIYGWCGSLTEKLRAGEILLPTRALSEEGTSQHYPVSAPCQSDSELRKELRNLLTAQGHAVQSGPIWTTDAPYRETREKVMGYRDQGIMAVDMEFSALCTVAAFRRVRLAAVLLVSDELSHDAWRPFFRTKDFKRKDRAIFQLLAEFAAN